MSRVKERPLEEMIKDLSPEMQAEVYDFVDFLLSKSKRGPGGKLKQGWAGALKEHGRSYDAVTLQHKASEWRTE